MDDAGKMLKDEYSIHSNKPFYQVSPEAGYWGEEAILRTVTMDEIIAKLGSEKAIAEYPVKPTPDEIKALTKGEFAYSKRHLDFTASQQKALGTFLTHPAFIARPPTGTVVNNRIRTGRLPIIKNGAELATMFESEKTAVWHQHVLLTLLDLPGEIPGKDGKPVVLRLREVISPVRQALMQAALHVTTLSALSAVWRFKWRSTPAAAATDPKIPERRVARRERPGEYFKRQGETFNVLFDSEVRFNADGDILRDVDRAPRLPPNAPDDFPGTPRHPAYGSGHSTYSKAASDVLKVFLPPKWGMPNIPGGMIDDIPDALDKLANSIGKARFWGGVHWLEDHMFGQTIGAAIAQLVVDQLNHSLVDPKPSALVNPPSRQDLETEFADVKKMKQPRWNWKKDGPFPRLEDDVDGAANVQGGRV
jgi:hypothetical protein